MVTMEDIAKRLGVTKGTVSKAINGAEDVSEAMRKTILETAVEMGYTKLSRSKEAPKMAILVENMAYSKPEDFGWDFLIGFRKMAEPSGYQVDIIPLDIPTQQALSYDEYMLLNAYKGGLFLGLNFRDPWMTEFQTCRTPTVLYDNVVGGNPCVTHVGVDNNAGMDKAVDYLKSMGHSKIGYLSGELCNYIYRERYEAFFRALRQNGLDSSEELGQACTSREYLPSKLEWLMELGCTAVLCSHDKWAQSVLLYCQEKKISVPERLSVVGFDDLPLCQTTTPPLSTIRQNRAELGRSAFYALSSQIDQIPISTLQLHPELIIRQSTGKA